MNAVEVPEIGLKFTPPQLLEQQRLASEHVIFSLTEACPLRCSHCIVSTVPAADLSRTMPLARAEHYAAQFPALRERGVTLISFTGGEPLLAPRQLSVLSEAAARAGMACSVVTACHWARSESSARSVVRRFGALSGWQLSIDIFHLEFISPEFVLNAARAVLDAGRQATVRMAASLPFSAEHRRLYERMRGDLPEEAPVIIQPVLRMGRGRSIEMADEEGESTSWPCVSNGIMFRFDGTIAPCCAGLADERTAHPFQYGNADEVGLERAHQSWCTDPLLQLIRSVGFAPVLGWAAETRAESASLRTVPANPCECCTRLWNSPEITAGLRERAQRAENREKIADLAERLFGETFMKSTREADAQPKFDG
ncbi:MAG: radical SAM protein [Terriglobia bacterium]